MSVRLLPWHQERLAFFVAIAFLSCARLANLRESTRNRGVCCQEFRHTMVSSTRLHLLQTIECVLLVTYALDD